MTTRHHIASVEDVSEEGSRVLTEVDGVEIAIFRVNEELYAMANYCVHQGGPLCEGELDGRVTVGEDPLEWKYDGEERNVLCPWHGWKFDVTTGESINNDRYKIPTYEVEVENGEVYVLR